MDSANEFTSFHDQVTSKLVQTTRAVGRVSSEDLKFHRSSNRDVAESLDEQSARLLSLTSSLLKVGTAGTDVKAPVLRNEESIDDNWRGLVDVIDNLLEKADACLDEFTGIIKKLSPSQEEQGQGSQHKAAPSKFPSIYESDVSTLPKPQLKFHHPPNNLDSSPFRPLLKTKPHAIVPLEESLQIIDANSESPL
jgi:exosome complex exonuclease RRP6